MSRAKGRCGDCGSTVWIRFETDGTGQLVEIREPCEVCSGAVCGDCGAPTPCGCPEWRRKNGVCRDCESPVEGTVGKALRCAPCKIEAQRRSDQRSYWRNRKKVLARDRRRRRQMSLEQRRRRNVQKKRWREENADLVRRERQRRKNAGYASREDYLEYQRRYNEARREEKLEYMKRYNKYGPDNPPTCRGCGAEVEFDGVGRPRLDCFDCRPEEARR